MNSDNERMQKLFQAALLDTSEKQASLARAFPTVTSIQQQVPAPAPAPAPAMCQVTAEPPQEPTLPGSSDLVVPLAQAGLCDTVSAELGALLDEQHRRKVSKRRRELIATVVIFLGLTGGSFAWFVHSPQRVLAAKQAIAEIKSAGDVASIVATYKKSLAKIATRATDIDNATVSMGVSSDQTGMKDVDMDAEMKQLMGGEGKTAGERNRVIKEKFGYLEKNGGTLKQAPPAPKSTKDPDISKDNLAKTANAGL
jgi:hypothetical protein